LLTYAVVASRTTVEYSLQLYEAGETDFVNVLHAQGALYAAETALVQSNANSSQNLIALCKTLGGGWEEAAGKGR
jgi:outer membrane protein TolC